MPPNKKRIVFYFVDLSLMFFTSRKFWIFHYWLRYSQKYWSLIESLFAKTKKELIGKKVLDIIKLWHFLTNAISLTNLSKTKLVKIEVNWCLILNWTIEQKSLKFKYVLQGCWVKKYICFIKVFLDQPACKSCCVCRNRTLVKWGFINTKGRCLKCQINVLMF